VECRFLNDRGGRLVIRAATYGNSDKAELLASGAAIWAVAALASTYKNWPAYCSYHFGDGQAMCGGFFADSSDGIPSVFNFVVWDLLFAGNLDKNITYFVDIFSYCSGHSLLLNFDYKISLVPSFGHAGLQSMACERPD
jgi:hypothetical protein